MELPATDAICPPGSLHLVDGDRRRAQYNFYRVFHIFDTHDDSNKDDGYHADQDRILVN